MSTIEKIKMKFGNAFIPGSWSMYQTPIRRRFYLWIYSGVPGSRDELETAGYWG